MTQIPIDNLELKQILKEAFTETLNEQRDLLHEVVGEVMEDFGLAEAIREGQRSERVKRSDVFDVLEGRG